MKKYTSKITLVLFLLFLGITNTQAAVNDCLLDVFQAELKEKNSEKLNDYFLNKSEEDLNKAFEAWKVLYQADEKADRLHIDNIETVLAFMVSAEKTVEEMVANIKYVKGFEVWKNLEYQFQKEGYTYFFETDMEPDGIKTIDHFVKKDGEGSIYCGSSMIYPDKKLGNTFIIKKELRRKGISKAIYDNVLKEGIKSIHTEFYDGGTRYVSDNYIAFMNEYNASISKDKVKAALATPSGIVLDQRGWEPTNIRVKKGEVTMVWVKKGTKLPGDNELNSPWINNLPTELRAQLFAEKGEMYDLFKSADPNERAKLAKSWEVLKNAAGLYSQPLMVIKLSTIGEKFHFNGIKGFDALKPLFTTYTTGYPDLNLLTKEMEFIDKLSELESLFNSTNDLPISFSCVENATYYDPIVLDESGDVIIRVEAGNIVKNKFFDKVDASYKKVGEYNGFDIFRKGDEIGFKSADIININR